VRLLSKQAGIDPAVTSMVSYVGWWTACCRCGLTAGVALLHVACCCMLLQRAAIETGGHTADGHVDGECLKVHVALHRNDTETTTREVAGSRQGCWCWWLVQLLLKQAGIEAAVTVGGGSCMVAAW
jgi:hypothetical protein